ncbi:MAG TPA: hypothetical protein VLM37_05950 [Fibrobacteraceae bacterium]|nr:hypothetical protein [Fibrobacteraceae bacterium]
MLKLEKLCPVLSLTAGILLALNGCGNVDSADLPEIKGGAVGLISPFDTVTAEFSTSVPSINVEQVDMSSPVNYAQSSSLKKWNIYGDTTLAGLTAFEPNTNYEIVFSDLKNEDGDVQDEDQRLSFTTMPILDKDFEEDEDGDALDNDKRTKADDLADSLQFFDSTDLDDGISIAGVISGDDDVDYFSIWVYYKDSVAIELSDLHDDLDLSFYGPMDSTETLFDGWDDLITTKTGTKDEVDTIPISAEAQDWGVNGVITEYGKALQYWIGVKPGSDFSSKSSYVLTVKKI